MTTSRRDDLAGAPDLTLGMDDLSRELGVWVRKVGIMFGVAGLGAATGLIVLLQQAA